MLRFRTTRAGLLLRTASEHSADRIELAVAAGRVRASVRLGDREKVIHSVRVLSHHLSTLAHHQASKMPPYDMNKLYSARKPVS